MNRFVAAAALVVALGLPAVAQDADTPLDKSIQKVEARLGDLKARANPDAKEIQWLEDLLASLREEKDRQDKAKAGGGGGGGGGNDMGRTPGQWMEGWFLSQAVQGVDLDQEEKAASDKVLREFGKDWALAREHGDEGSKRVIWSDVQDRLERAVPKKKAQQIISNVSPLLWRGRGK